MKFEDMINTIQLGDCYELIKLIPDKSIDLIYTDPPYKIEGLHTGTGILKDRSKNLNHYVNQMRNLQIDKGIDYKILDEFVRVMKNIYIYIWCNKEQIIDYLDYFVKKHKCNYEFIIWHKTNVAPFTNGHYLKDKEYCLLFWKNAKIKGKYEDMSTVYHTSINTSDKDLYKHPTIKPIEFVKKHILNSTNENDIVLDCFCGSGTTCVAAKELGRRFIGMEIDKEYHRIAVNRLNGITADGQLSLFTDISQIGGNNKR